MKKTYIVPRTMTVHIHSTHMLATSTYNIDVVEGTYEGTFNAKGNKSQNYSVWDDDWSNE